MLQFKKDSIEELEDIYENLEIADEEQNFFQAASKVLKKFIHLPQNVIVAIIWIGFKEWYKINKKTLSDIEKMQLDKQIKITQELYDIRKKCLERLLTNPEKDGKTLERQIDKAFKYHLNLFHKLINKAKKDGIKFYFI